ncbi:hypothetical protein ACIBCA_25190 [Kitasatospora sp. NPDC051170]|uniref:hypothetical protein n=1 Tax=Kitasatospora sp. NPDC051170 TaxID=3364056 RepID=UPI0037B7DDDF
MLADITLDLPRAHLLFVAVLVLGTVLVLGGFLPAESLWGALAAPLARLTAGPAAGRTGLRYAGRLRGGRAAR